MDFQFPDGSAAAAESYCRNPKAFDEQHGVILSVGVKKYPHCYTGPEIGSVEFRPTYDTSCEHLIPLCG